MGERVRRLSTFLVAMQSILVLAVPTQVGATALQPNYILGGIQYSSTLVAPQLTGHIYRDTGESDGGTRAFVEATRLGVVVGVTGVNDDGTYSLNIAPGIYDMKFVPGSGEPYADKLIPGVDVSATHVLDATFARSTHQFSGHLTDGAGNGLSGLAVHLNETRTVVGAAHVYDATTDASGDYAITTSGGVYAVTVSGDSSNTDDGLPQHFGYNKSIDTRNADVGLSLPFAGRQVQLQAFGADDNPLAGAAVTTHSNPNDYGNTGYSFDSAVQTDELGFATVTAITAAKTAEDSISVHVSAPGEDVTKYYSADAFGDMTLHLSGLSTPVGVGLLTATNQNISAVNLTWQGDSSASGYRIFRNGSFLAETTSRQYSDTLPGEDTYSYSVYALDAAGDLSGGNRALVWYDHTPPVLADPVAVADPVPYDSYIYDNYDHSLNGSFPAIMVPNVLGDPSTPSRAEYFSVTSGDPGAGHGRALVQMEAGTPVSNLQTPEFHLNPGQYTYGVRGGDEFGNWSPVKYVTLNVVDRREPTNVLAASPTTAYPMITWSAAPEAVSYRVYRNDNQYVGSTSGTSMVDTALTASGTNKYSVRGVDAQGNVSFQGHNDYVYVEYDRPVDVGVPTLSVNPKAPSQTSVLTASVDVPVAAAEYYLDNDPGVGNGIPMNNAGSSVNATIGTDVPVGSHAVHVRVQDAAGEWVSASPVTLTVDDSAALLTAVSPAKVWVGLKTSDDVGTKFDLLAEVYEDNTLVTSGQLNSVAAGSSGFSNAKLDTITFNSFSPVAFSQGQQLKLKLYARTACTGSAHNSGTARLWLNDAAANSQFGATIGTSTSDYYLLSNLALGTSVGPGPKTTVDLAGGTKCSAFKPFGTWAIAPQVPAGGGGGGGGSNL